MNRWNLDVDDDADVEETTSNRSTRRLSRGKMPVGSDAKAKAASKATYRSKRTGKQISRATGGMRNRRNKRFS